MRGEKAGEFGNRSGFHSETGLQFEVAESDVDQVFGVKALFTFEETIKRPPDCGRGSESAIGGVARDHHNSIVCDAVVVDPIAALHTRWNADLEPHGVNFRKLRMVFFEPLRNVLCIPFSVG